MKKLNALVVFSLSLLLITGCKTDRVKEQAPLVPIAQEPKLEAIPDTEKQEEVLQKSSEGVGEVAVTLFKGAWFDVQYPKNFTPRPTEPVYNYSGDSRFPDSEGGTKILTDEAYFTSPDEAVEFFVYSPLWSGEPEAYLEIAATEELVSEKIEEIKESDAAGQYGDKVVRWVTIKAKDGSYHRSFVSIKEQVRTGSDLHHVLGIRYQDEASLKMYAEAYRFFKESLQQYAD